MAAGGAVVTYGQAQSQDNVLKEVSHRRKGGLRQSIKKWARPDRQGARA